MNAAGSGTGPEASCRATCHATCLVLGEAGILIRGAAGTGKSALCLDLLDRADTAGDHARLVGDDRVQLTLRDGRVVARGHPAVAGLIEIRGLGIRRLADVAEAAVIRLVVDLVGTVSRLPGEWPEPAIIIGIALPRLVLEPSQPRAYVIRQALTAMQQDRRQDGIVSSRTHSAALLVAEHCDV